MAVNERIIMQEIKCNQNREGTDFSVFTSWCITNGGRSLITCTLAKFKSTDDAESFEFNGIVALLVWVVWKRGQKITPINGDQQRNATTTTRKVSLAVLNSSLSWKNWYTLDALRETLNESRLAT